MKVNIIIILQFHQKFCVVILKKVYSMFPLKYFIILLLNIVYGIIKDRQKFKKNKLCYNEGENNHKIYLLYKAITNFPFIHPEYLIFIIILKLYVKYIIISIFKFFGIF